MVKCFFFELIHKQTINQKRSGKKKEKRNYQKKLSKEERIESQGKTSYNKSKKK